MDTQKVSIDYRLSRWATVIKERNESGLTIKAFCEKHIISENSYFYWQRKVRETACETLVTKNRKANLVPYGFSEVNLSEPAELSAPAIFQQYQISIEAHGVRLSACNEYPVDKLAKLLREVTRSC